LNTLTTLIAENHDLAINFTQKLSDVYRYILQNREKELVTLTDEVGFVQDYLYLLKMRYPDNLNAEFRIKPEFMRTHIAPLTIQILVENCIKHNIVSKANPLTIEVYVENGNSIVVKNNLQPKKAIEKSTQTGLENIRKRYEYLGNKQIEIISTIHHFMVAVPLIEVSFEREGIL
ncbi:MAG: histidine kinase, partial [Cyclobacteriaceae bacterium]